MRTSHLIVLVSVLLLSFVGCGGLKEETPTAAATDPTTTVLTESAEETQPDATEDPFEYESEIDFSDFITEPNVTQPDVTEPVAEQPQATEPEITEPKPTEPNSTEPEKPMPSDPEPTEPEDAQPPTTTTPSVGADGYNNQIVRP